jgi:hypothetical protein
MMQGYEVRILGVHYEYFLFRQKPLYKMSKNQEPTTDLGKARRWFRQAGLELEKERGAVYVKFNKYLSLQITEEEVTYRARMYDLDNTYRLNTEESV